MSFDEIFDLTAGVYFNFFNIYLVRVTYEFIRVTYEYASCEHCDTDEAVWEQSPDNPTVYSDRSRKRGIGRALDRTTPRPLARVCVYRDAMKPRSEPNQRLRVCEASGGFGG